MAPPILAIVSPNDWVSRTNLTFRKRGESMLKVDKAYADYFAIRSEGNRQALYRELRLYLTEKGGNWSQVSRNKASNGLMEYIYNATSPPRRKNILEMRAPEARHGVLYLWQHAEVKTQWMKIILEGALNVGSNATSFMSANFASNSPLAPASVIPNSISGIPDGVTWAQTGQQQFLSPGGSAKKPPPLPQETPTPTILVSDIREDPSILQRARQFLGAAFEKIWKLIKDTVEKIWEDTRLKWYSGQLAGQIGSITVAVANFILGKVVANAAPFASSAIGVAQGLAQTFSAGRDRVSAWYQRGKFIVTPGHPEMIAKAIETQMNWDIGKGLYGIAKNGAALTGEAFSAGASSLANLIAACLEFAYKLFTRLRQSQAMNGWIRGVQDVVLNRSGWRADPLDGRWRPAICYDEKAFQALFEEGCNASVCIPMMTLNSGISGDLMMFMKMFDDTGRILGQSTGESLGGPSQNAIARFGAGDTYWTGMKQKSRSYLESTGFEFSSKDVVAQGLMAHAIEHHNGVASLLDQALGLIAGS